MKTAILANLLLLPLVLLFTSIPVAGVAYLVMLAYVSRTNKNVKHLWLRYYHEILKVENNL